MFYLARELWPLTALQIVRLVLALPVGRNVYVAEVDWDAGTFRYALL